MVPTQVKLHKKSKTLEIHFGDEHYTLAAEYLRVYSPSAEVRGHGNPVLQHGKINVGISNITPVGNYAVKITFDDGHDSGIFDWGYLQELGREYESKWEAYLAELRAAGKTRDPNVSVVQLMG